MRQILRIFILLCLSSAGIATAATPATIRATYDIHKLGLKIGEIEETFRRDENDRYTLISSTRAIGLFALFKSGKIIVRSNGLIESQGLRPLAFSADNENNKHDHKHAEFDWNTKKILLTLNNNLSTLDLPDRTQDRLSAMYQFMFIPPHSSSFVFNMLNGSYMLQLNFDVVQGPQVKTPAGEFATLYLDNKARGTKDRTEIWLATKSFNIPCKMIVTDPDGGKITQLLSSLSFVQ